MDLSKLLSLLEKKALFFPRVDVLARLDPFEGYYSSATLTAIRGMNYESIPEQERKEHFPDKETFDRYRQSLYRVLEFARSNRAATFVNSWYAADYESAAMWSQYLKSDEGIAVKSTFGRLVEALAGYDDYEVHIGYVDYLDYASNVIPMTNLLKPFLTKRRSFQHERELRALIWTLQHGKNSIENNKYKDQLGLYVPVDLSTLIEAVYLAPSTQQWQFEAISGLLERYGFDNAVNRSELSSAPLF